MKFATILASLTLCVATVAMPGWTNSNEARPGAPPRSCLEQADADDLVAKFISVLQHPDIDAANVTAQALLGPNFFEKSDSINLLAGQPIGSITFSSKAQYIQSVLHAPSVTNITTYKILIAGCTNILWYWNIGGVGSKQIPVDGFNLLKITPDKQIANIFVEFNNIGWAIDTGYTIVSPNGTKLPLA